jgi:hypothetical protein
MKIHPREEIRIFRLFKNVIFWDVRRVTLVRTVVSEKRIALIIRVKRVGEIGTTLALTSNHSTLHKNHRA